MEHWKPVVGYEGIYEVSSTGHVRSVRRLIRMRVGAGRVFEEMRGGRVLKPSPNMNGYLFVCLRNASSEQVHSRRARSMSIHRLVCEAFHGPPPSTTHQVNHKDGNKANNSPDNLEWMTPLENVQHSVFVLGTHVKGSTHHASKLNESDIPDICNSFNSGTYIKDLARQYCVSTNVINGILACRSWKHVPRPPKPHGKRLVRSRFSDDDIRLIKTMRLNGASFKDIRAVVCISHGMLSRVVNGSYKNDIN